MYAVLIQSAPSVADIRQTVVVAHGSSVLAWHRIAGKRGIAGAWNPGTPEFVTGERVLGTPVSLLLTANNIGDIDAGRKPESLLQNIQRKVTSTEVSQALAGETLDEILDEARLNPADLAKYDGRGQVVAQSPVVTIVREPVAQPVAPAPEPVVAPVAVQVAEPVVTVEQGGELHPALHTPTRDEVQGYVERDIVPGVKETQFFRIAQRQGKAVGIWGHAGTGKTSSARHLASAWGVPFVTIDCNPQTDEAVLQGEWIPTGKGNQLAWRWSPLAEAILTAKSGAVVLINEANRMSAKANAYFLRILAERRLLVSRYDNRDLVIPENVLFIFDSNPGYKGTTSMDEAFEDRFISTTYEYDRDVESQFIKSKSLLDVAFSIRNRYDAREVRTLFTTRMLRDFQDIALDPEGGFELAKHILLDKFRNAVDNDAVKMTLELHESAIKDELGL